MQDFLFTSESVSEGHPDKVADRISDEVLDFYLREAKAWDYDPAQIRTAVETLVTTNRVILAGEVRGPDFPHSMIETVIREAIKDIGYEQKGFHWEHVQIQNYLHKQSADIAQGVDAGEGGAGDQGIIFGHACVGPGYMPHPIFYANRILRNLSWARKAKLTWVELGPDSKAQLTIRYADGKPVEVTHVVLSTQHVEDFLGSHPREVTSGDIRTAVEPFIRGALPDGWITKDTVWHINPTGKFVIGGPDGDAGLTGRKIIVDTYGGAAPHGGGAFSGKDPTKVDRSAAYAARYLAKNIVAAGYAKRCTIQLSYVIGGPRPLSIYVDTHGTSQVTGRLPLLDSEFEKVIPKIMDLSPQGIIRHLGLIRPIYAETAAYGHFGRYAEAGDGFSWEKLGLVDELHKQLG